MLLSMGINSQKKGQGTTKLPRLELAERQEDSEDNLYSQSQTLLSRARYRANRRLSCSSQAAPRLSSPRAFLSCRASEEHRQKLNSSWELQLLEWLWQSQLRLRPWLKTSSSAMSMAATTATTRARQPQASRFSLGGLNCFISSRITRIFELVTEDSLLENTLSLKDFTTSSERACSSVTELTFSCSSYSLLCSPQPCSIYPSSQAISSTRFTFFCLYGFYMSSTSLPLASPFPSSTLLLSSRTTSSSSTQSPNQNLTILPLLIFPSGSCSLSNGSSEGYFALGTDLLRLDIVRVKLCSVWSISFYCYFSAYYCFLSSLSGPGCGRGARQSQGLLRPSFFRNWVLLYRMDYMQRDILVGVSGSIKASLLLDSDPWIIIEQQRRNRSPSYSQCIAISPLMVISPQTIPSGSHSSVFRSDSSCSIGSSLNPSTWLCISFLSSIKRVLNLEQTTGRLRYRQKPKQVLQGKSFFLPSAYQNSLKQSIKKKQSLGANRNMLAWPTTWFSSDPLNSRQKAFSLTALIVPSYSQSTHSTLASRWMTPSNCRLSERGMTFLTTTAELRKPARLLHQVGFSLPRESSRPDSIQWDMMLSWHRWKIVGITALILAPSSWCSANPRFFCVFLEHSRIWPSDSAWHDTSRHTLCSENLLKRRLFTLELFISEVPASSTKFLDTLSIRASSKARSLEQIYMTQWSTRLSRLSFIASAYCFSILRVSSRSQQAFIRMGLYSSLVPSCYQNQRQQRLARFTRSTMLCRLCSNYLAFSMSRTPPLDSLSLRSTRYCWHCSRRTQAQYFSWRLSQGDSAKWWRPRQVLAQRRMDSKWQQRESRAMSLESLNFSAASLMNLEKQCLTKTQSLWGWRAELPPDLDLGSQSLSRSLQTQAGSAQRSQCILRKEARQSSFFLTWELRKREQKSRILRSAWQSEWMFSRLSMSRSFTTRLRRLSITPTTNVVVNPTKTMILSRSSSMFSTSRASRSTVTVRLMLQNTHQAFDMSRSKQGNRWKQLMSSREEQDAQMRSVPRFLKAPSGNNQQRRIVACSSTKNTMYSRYGYLLAMSSELNAKLKQKNQQVSEEKSTSSRESSSTADSASSGPLCWKVSFSWWSSRPTQNRFSTLYQKWVQKLATAPKTGFLEASRLSMNTERTERIEPAMLEATLSLPMRGKTNMQLRIRGQLLKLVKRAPEMKKSRQSLRRKASPSRKQLLRLVLKLAQIGSQIKQSQASVASSSFSRDCCIYSLLIRNCFIITDTRTDIVSTTRGEWLSRTEKSTLLATIRKLQVKNEDLIRTIKKDQNKIYKRHSKLLKPVSSTEQVAALQQRLLLLEAEEAALLMHINSRLLEEEGYKRYIATKKAETTLEAIVMPDLKLENTAIESINTLNRAVSSLSRRVERLKEIESEPQTVGLLELQGCYKEVESLRVAFERASMQLEDRREKAAEGRIIYSCEAFDLVRVDKAGGSQGRPGRLFDLSRESLLQYIFKLQDDLSQRVLAGRPLAPTQSLTLIQSRLRLKKARSASRQFHQNKLPL